MLGTGLIRGPRRRCSYGPRIKSGVTNEETIALRFGLSLLVHVETGQRPIADVPFVVIPDLFQDPWSAVSFDTALTERSGRGC